MSDRSSPRSSSSGECARASSSSSATTLEWMEAEAVPAIHVRSQARRKVRLKDDKPRSKRAKPSDDVNDAEGPGSGSELRPSSQSESPEGTVFPRVRCPDGNAHDPFDCLVISRRGRSHFYIKHYFLTFKHTYPSDVMTYKQKKNTAMSHALRDPAFLHATLFHSALNLCKLHGTSFSRDVFYHHGESIRIINQRLKDPNLRQVSDITILTVACLIHFEILADFGFNGVKAGMDQQEAKVHMDGLEAMINGRGGLEQVSTQFTSGKATCTFVGWTDTCVSIALNLKPRFALVQSEREIGSDEWPPYSNLAQRYQRKLLNLTGHEALSTEAVEIYSGLQHVPPLPEDEAFKLIKNGEPAVVYHYKGHIERLERRLIALIQTAREPSERSLHIYELFGNAALIHALAFMRDSPGSIPISRLLSSRLRRTLEITSLHNLILQYTELVLWILVMGGLGALGTLNQKWFANVLAKVCLALGLIGKEDISATVREFLWFDLYGGPGTVAFWEDVGTAQGVGGKEVVIRSPPKP